MHEALECWKCGADVADLPMPLGRQAACPACEADLHVCRMCSFYEPTVAKSCREPVADEVRDKERSNFCDYFQARPGAHRDGSAADAARAELESLFGLGPAPSPGSDRPDPQALLDERKRAAEAARKELNKLFGSDED